MHRIDADSHVGNQFSDGNPSTGQPGTRVDAAWLNAVQEEIAGVVEASGATLARGSNTQMRTALAPVTAKAWARITHDGGIGVPVVRSGHGVSGASIVDGKLRVAFSAPFLGSNEYACVPHARMGTGIVLVTEFARSGLYVDFWIINAMTMNPHSIASSMFEFDLVVFGVPAP